MSKCKSCGLSFKDEIKMVHNQDECALAMKEDRSEKKYKYIHFVCIDKKVKTSVWSCRNNKYETEIGHISWYGAWRQYCFFPKGYTVFSKGCLEDINCFITKLADEKLESVKTK